MMSPCCCALAGIDGNAALTLSSGPRLVLIEGGRPEAANEPVSARLSARQVLMFVGMAMALTVALCVAAVLGDARAAGVPARALDGLSERTMVVQSGDSLWSISSQIEVGGVPTSDVVSWIVERNGLEQSCLMPGQRLVVPMVSEG